MSKDVRIHPHAAERMETRGATESEVFEAIHSGEEFPAKHGRTGFRRNFAGKFLWRGRSFDTKQVEVYAAPKTDAWLAITVIVRFFSRSEAE
jgi:hypothetical protein